MAIRKDLFCQHFLGMFLKNRGQEKYFFYFFRKWRGVDFWFYSNRN
jgi:hypothetical protein